MYRCLYHYRRRRNFFLLYQLLGMLYGRLGLSYLCLGFHVYRIRFFGLHVVRPMTRTLAMRMRSFKVSIVRTSVFYHKLICIRCLRQRGAPTTYQINRRLITIRQDRRTNRIKMFLSMGVVQSTMFRHQNNSGILRYILILLIRFL